MSRRHRILAWVKTDAQRMKDEAILAKVTARITQRNTNETPPLSDMLWSEFDRAVLAARGHALLVFNKIVPARIMRTQRPNLSASQVWPAALSAQVNHASVFADMIDRVVYDLVKAPRNDPSQAQG